MNTRILAAAGGSALLAAMMLSTIVRAQPPEAAPATPPAVAAPTAAPTVNGEALFNGRCKFCHEPATGGAPDRAALAAYAKPDIVAALTTGAMVGMARGMSPEDIDAIAVYLTTPAAAGAAAPAAPAEPAPNAPLAD